MALISCIECNRQISDSAPSCPGCSASEPRGVTCKLCTRQMRRSDGFTCKRTIFMSPSSGYSTWEEVAHKECIDRYFTPPQTLACPDCGLRLAGINDNYTSVELWKRGETGSSCPGCGALDVFGGESRNRRCCGAPFYPFQGEFPNGHGHTPRDDQISEQKAGCFIATAVLEGGYTEHLAVLYNFRDQFLMASVLGRRCVRVYYRLSPPLAAYFEESRVAKVIIRRCFILPAATVLRVRWLQRRAE